LHVPFFVHHALQKLLARSKGFSLLFHTRFLKVLAFFDLGNYASLLAFSFKTPERRFKRLFFANPDARQLSLLLPVPGFFIHDRTNEHMNINIK